MSGQDSNVVILPEGTPDMPEPLLRALYALLGTDSRQAVDLAWKIGYMAGVKDAEVPYRPDDLEAIASQMLTVANRLRLIEEMSPAVAALLDRHPDAAE